MGSKGKRKPADDLRDLRQKSTTDEELTEMLSIVVGKGPASTLVLYGTAVVEIELERTIRPRFNRSDDKTWKRLTADIGPLATFHQKIETAYALKCIDDTARENLRLLKEIRNTFAHPKKVITLGKQFVIDAFKEIKLPAKKTGFVYKHLHRALNSEDHKEQLVRLVYGLARQLWEIRQRRQYGKDWRRRKKLHASFTEDQATTALVGGDAP